MSPSELRYWQNAHRKVVAMQPDISAAILRAFSIIRDSLTESELARLIESGQFDVLVSRVFSEQVLDRAFIPLRARLRDATHASFRYTAPSLPKGGKVNGVLAVSFDHLSPHVVQGIRRLETKVITGLSDDIRETVRAVVENGLRDGANPRAIAREIRPLVGMSPTQEKHAAKYEAKQVEQGLTPEKVAARVATYQRKAVALNAETISRTATLDAFKLGQKLAWDDAIEKGIIEPGRLTKTWRGILDDRERPEHLAMEGQIVPFGALYSNGQDYPGQGEWNCRCLSVFRVA